MAWSATARLGQLRQGLERRGKGPAPFGGVGPFFVAQRQRLSSRSAPGYPVRRATGRKQGSRALSALLWAQRTKPEMGRIGGRNGGAPEWTASPPRPPIGLRVGDGHDTAPARCDQGSRYPLARAMSSPRHSCFLDEPRSTQRPHPAQTRHRSVMVKTSPMALPPFRSKCRPRSRNLSGRVDLPVACVVDQEHASRP